MFTPFVDLMSILIKQEENMANITIKELVEKLKDIPEDHVISESVLERIHGIVKFEEIKNKKVKITLNKEISISELYDPSEEEDFKEFLTDYDNVEEAVKQWNYETGCLDEITYDYKLEISK